jgi:predicted nucleic acid-binding protein
MVEKANVPNPKIKARAVKAALEALKWFRVEPLTSVSAAVGGNLHAMLANKGKTISERDSMVAGIAMVHDYVMVTDNVAEYSRVPGLFASLTWVSLCPSLLMPLITR